jgi:hypothetical protein
VKEWCFEWFYAGNMLPALAVHFDSGPSVNDHWENNCPVKSIRRSSHCLIEFGF